MKIYLFIKIFDKTFLKKFGIIFTFINENTNKSKQKTLSYRNMKKDLYNNYLQTNAALLEKIKTAAWQLHESVGQTYDGHLPYGHHLSMVADAALRHGAAVISREEDIVPVVFAAYFHDSIEDARLTYNDVTKLAKTYMSDAQAIVAAEIVYALTNDKGRTRAERAGEHYYQGIRTTPYAPFVKLCDRLANMTYSFRGTNADNNHMHEVYSREWPHFLQAITVVGNDTRLALPEEMRQEIEALMA